MSLVLWQVWGRCGASPAFQKPMPWKPFHSPEPAVEGAGRSVPSSFSFSEDVDVDAPMLVAVGALSVSQALCSEVDASSKEPGGGGSFSRLGG